MKINITTNWVIYRITNPKGRTYIGKTCRFKIRIGSYRCHDCAAQKIVHSSIKKYGFDSHTIDVLESFNSSNDYANEREMYWISFYKTNVYRHGETAGMNMTDGGDGNFGRKLSEDQKKKIGEFHKGNQYTKGQKRTEEQNRNQSLRMKGMTAWNKGKSPSEETKIKISKSLMGRPSLYKGVQGRMSVEGKERMRLANTGKTPWNIGKKHSEESKQKMSESHYGKVSRKTPIVQYDLLGNFVKEFGTVKEAALELGITTTGIFYILSGKIKAPKTFTFKRKQIV